MLAPEEVLRFDHRRKTYAIIRDTNGKTYATDGICTHGNQHLAEGLVKDGIIECPKHNGRFHLEDGSPARAPVCRGLATYPVEVRDRQICLNISKPGGAGARQEVRLALTVIKSRNVTSFIKEITLAATDSSPRLEFQPGDYLQFEIPAFERLAFQELPIDEPFRKVWESWKLFDLVASNPAPMRNNYSLANHPGEGGAVKLNVRIAMPSPRQDCPPGRGSSWMFHLLPGDTITAFGPYGDFHIKPTQKEMVYIGGGAGMGPLRSHIIHLFHENPTRRKVGFWYASRSRQELYYAEEFEALAAAHPNFSFHVSLSSPLEEDQWTGRTGRIHEVIEEDSLRDHPNIRAVEFYLCGPPPMIDATVNMLRRLGVSDDQIAYDAF